MPEGEDWTSGATAPWTLESLSPGAAARHIDYLDGGALAKFAAGRVSANFGVPDVDFENLDFRQVFGELAEPPLRLNPGSGRLAAEKFVLEDSELRKA